MLLKLASTYSLTFGLPSVIIEKRAKSCSKTVYDVTCV